MKKRFFIIAGIIIVIIAGILFYNTKQINKSEEDTIKIGILIPLTGPVGYIGENIQKGFEQALNDINKDKKVIEIIYEDNENNPAKAVTAAKNLVEFKGVDILITSMSGSSIAVASYLKDTGKNIPLIATGVYADIPAIYSNTFQMAINMTSEVDAYKKWENKIKPNKLGILYANNDFGVQLSKLIKDSSSLSSSKTLEPFEQTDRTFKTQLLKLKNSGVDVIYVTLLSSPDTIVKEAREIGFKGSIILSSAVYLNGLISNDVFNNVYTSVPSSYLSLNSTPVGNIEISSETLYLLNKYFSNKPIKNIVNFIINERSILTKTQGELIIDQTKKTVYFPLDIVKIQNGKLIEIR